MKKIMLVFYVLILCLNDIHAQSYHPMLGDSNTWYVDVRLLAPGNINDMDDTLHLSYSSKYYTNSDSTVNKKKYKKFYVKDSFAQYSMADTGFVGLIREDTSKRQVFFIHKDSLKELLIYDFSLKTGDKIFLNFPTGITGFWPVSAIYTATDSGNISTNVGMLKKINFEYYQAPGESFSWAEALGGLSSPLYFMPPYNDDVDYNIEPLIDIKVNLGCAFKDGVKIYGGSNCQYSRSYVTGKSGINYANPTTPKISNIVTTPDNLTFSTININMGNLSVSLYDLPGRELFQGGIEILSKKASQYQISLKNPLKPGIYLAVFSTQGFSYSQKILVND